MNNFTPGGMRNRRPDLGGRPKSDADYRPNKRFDSAKPRFDARDKKDVVLHKTNCTTCGKACEVPFRPDGAKPVLCSVCFAEKNASPTNQSTNRERFTPNERVGHKSDRSYGAPAAPTRSSAPSVDLTAVTKQLAILEAKVSQILDLLKTTPKATEPIAKVAKAPKAALDSTSEVVVEEPKKERKPKKTTVAKKVAKKAAKKAIVKKAKKK